MTETTLFFLYKAKKKHIDTGEELAERMGISYPTLSKRMKDPKKFTIEDLLRLEYLTGITVSEVIDMAKEKG